MFEDTTWEELKEKRTNLFYMVAGEEEVDVFMLSPPFPMTEEETNDGVYWTIEVTFDQDNKMQVHLDKITVDDPLVFLNTMYEDIYKHVGIFSFYLIKQCKAAELMFVNIAHAAYETQKEYNENDH